MIFEAAVKAYSDAGIEPDQVDTFMSVSEDYLEGTAIVDEYVPDQLGAVLKPVHTIGADGITGLASAFLQIRTGQFEVALVEGRSKASNVLHPAHIDAFALDPVYVRPLELHPRFVAGLEMRAFLEATGNTEEQAAAVVEKNRGNACRNPMAAHPARTSAQDVLRSAPIAEPLKEGDAALPADGSIVIILASAEAAARMKGQPVYIEGVGWAQDTPNIEERDWSRAAYAEEAARQAYRMAKISDPAGQIQFAEVDDAFAYKELQHLESVGLAPTGMAGRMLEQGEFSPGGRLPVNASGGSLGCGHVHDLAGLRSVMEAALQLRGDAGDRQLNNPRVGLAQSWRGVPTASGGAAVLSRR